MKHPLFEKLREMAPSIVFDVERTEDPTFRWDGDGPDPIHEGYVAYDVDFTAKAIVCGTIIEATASLGGTYEKPGEFDPDVGGYLTQKLQEAAEELLENETLDATQRKQLDDVCNFLQAELIRLYKEQRNQKCQLKK